MAKSTHQKQREAIERKRANLGTHQQNLLVVYAAYEKTKANFGKEWADTLLSNAHKVLKKAAAEANCDTHGNPL